MPRFRYQAANDDGNAIEGVMFADNLLDLEQRIEGMGFWLVKAKAVKDRRSRAGKIARQELIFLYTQIGTSLDAGITVLDALSDVRDSTVNPRLRELLVDIIERVGSGESISAAFGAHRAVFGDLVVGLLSNAEHTGRLEHAFRNAADHLEWVEGIASKTRKMMIYPTIVGIVALGVVAIMMIKVVPAMAKMMASLGIPESQWPLLTRALMSTSRFVTEGWPWLVFPVAVVVVLWLWLQRYRAVRLRMDRAKLRLPMVGELLRQLAVARFAHHLALLYRAGIPLVQALEASRRVMGNLCIEEGVGYAVVRVGEGEPVSKALRVSGQFPELVIRMVRVGESTGRMDESLDRVARYYERVVEESVTKALTALEPAIMVVLGLLVGWIVGAFFMAYMQIMASI